MIIRLFITFLFVSFFGFSFAQEKEIIWFDWSIKNSQLELNNTENLIFSSTYEFKQKHKIEVSLDNPIYQVCTQNELALINNEFFKSENKFIVKQGFERNITKVLVDINPLIKENGIFKKLIYVELNFTKLPNLRKAKSSKDNSLLNNGDWHK